MANEDVQKLVAVVEARSAAAEKQMERFVRAADKRMAEFERRASRAAVKVESRMSSAFTKISGAAKTLFAGFAGLASVNGLTMVMDRVVSAASRLDELGDTASRLGTSAGQLVQWQAALESSGGSMDDFAQSAEDFIGKIGKLSGGIGKVKVIKDALAAVGASPQDLVAAETLQEKLLLIADAVEKIKDPTVKAAFADALGLRPMLPLLEQGRAGVEKLVKEFDGLGSAADEGVERTGDLADKIKLLQLEMQLKSDNLFVRLAPIIANIYQLVSDVIDLMNNPVFGRILASSIPGMDMGAILADSLKAPKIKAEIASLEKDLAALRIGGTNDVGGAMGRMERRLAILKTELAAMESSDTSGLSGAPRGYSPNGTPPVITELTAEEEAALAAAAAFRDLSKARADWRNDPEAKYDSRQTLEDISGRQSDLVGQQLAPMIASADAAAALRDEFRSAFRYAFQQLTEGDFAGAAATFAGSFVNKLNDRISDQLFDFVWDTLGLGDVAGDLFGPLDAAQAAQAVSTVQATTAINLMATAAYNAATALATVGGGGGGGGLFGSIGSFVAGLFGGTGPIKGVGSGIGGGIGKRALGGPVIAGQPYIVGEKRPELFVPNTSGHIIPRIPQAVSRGASLTFAPVINAPGADPAAITRIEAMMQRSQADFKVWAANEKGRVRGHISDLRSRRAI